MTPAYSPSNFIKFAIDRPQNTNFEPSFSLKCNNFLKFFVLFCQIWKDV